jgi:hypothetical protein
MDTTTDTPTETPLPTLTPTECDAALAWIEPGAPSPLQLAAQLKLSPHELLDILARPHVAAFAEAVRALVQTRADILACYNHTTSLQNLAEIAQNRDADIHVRLRAAIAILQGARAAPTVPGGSKPDWLPDKQSTSPAPRFRLPAPPEPPGTPAVPGGPQPDQSTSNEPSSAPTNKPRPVPSTPNANAARSNTPITLHRAAGAPLARHDRRADPDGSIEYHRAPCAASPASSGHPP